MNPVCPAASPSSPVFSNLRFHPYKMPQAPSGQERAARPALELEEAAPLAAGAGAGVGAEASGVAGVLGPQPLQLPTPQLSTSSPSSCASTPQLPSEVPQWPPQVSCGPDGLRGERSASYWLLEAGNALYAAEPAARTQAVRLWLQAGVGSQADRLHLCAELGRVGTLHLAPAAKALVGFHMAWLGPTTPEAREVLQRALEVREDLAEAMVELLCQLETQKGRGPPLAPLKFHYGPLVGEVAKAQKDLVGALREGRYEAASHLADRLKAGQNHIFVAHFAAFVCAFEAGGGTQADGQFVADYGKNVFWARGLVGTVESWEPEQHFAALHALNRDDYRFVWFLFLSRYAALCPKDFEAPPGWVQNPRLPRGDVRFVRGLFWSDALALPLSKAWPAHAGQLAAIYAMQAG